MKSGSRKLARVLLAAGAAWLLAGYLPVADTAVAAFPGGNGAIAYECFHQDVGQDICTINADGTGQAQLTSDGHDGLPAWSPDGNQIAFDCSSGICVMDADGSNQKLLAKNGDAPAWSPDASRIAFDCGGICVMDADGSNRTQLTSGFDAGLSWSPDGSKIAFSENLEPAGSDLYVMNEDGSGLTPLTNAGASNNPPENRMPDWSPDGTEIAFSSTRDVSPPSFGEIYVMNADGSGVTRLTFGGTNSALNPSWSPDGTKIAFWSDRVTGGEIDVMNADGSALTTLTTPGTNPDWQPLTATPPPFSDLVLRMAGPRHIGPGDPITYTIHVRNDGPSRADGVVVTDPLPAGTQLIRAYTGRGSCSPPDPASGALVCWLGSMSDGSTRTIILVCRAAAGAGTTLTNVATVSSLSRDPNEHDNSATIVTRVGR
jgi:uncharacterized repeat protein (TIGR01451 family)